MPSYSRAEGRNVHIFNANDPNAVLGGLILTNGVTNTNLYDMVEIIVIVTCEYFLQDEGNIKIAKDNHPLQPGNYYIVAASKFITTLLYVDKQLNYKQMPSKLTMKLHLSVQFL